MSASEVSAHSRDPANSTVCKHALSGARNDEMLRQSCRAVLKIGGLSGPRFAGGCLRGGFCRSAMELFFIAAIKKVLLRWQNKCFSRVIFWVNNVVSRCVGLVWIGIRAIFRNMGSNFPETCFRPGSWPCERFHH